MDQQLPPSAPEQYRARTRIQVATLAAVRRAWDAMGDDFDAGWRVVGPRVLVLLSAAQLRAAAEAAAYVSLATLEQALDPTTVATTNPRAFAGQASDGRSLATLLSESVIRAKTDVGAGATVTQALRSGRDFLDLVTLTQIADAGRGSELVTMTATPTVTGYVRMLNPPSCSRCVILAGKRFKWDNDFRRHPRCDCLTVPSGAAEGVAGAQALSPEAYFRNLTPAQQDATFGKANADAIREGASPITVVNSYRGTFTPSGQRAPTPGNRPTPGHIYAQADGDRDKALELLRAAGYLT